MESGFVFHYFGGPRAHDHSGRDDKFVTKLEMIFMERVIAGHKLVISTERSGVERSAVSFWFADLWADPAGC